MVFVERDALLGTLRLEIGEGWSVIDFTEIFESLQFLYDIASLTEIGPMADATIVSVGDILLGVSKRDQPPVLRRTLVRALIHNLATERASRKVPRLIVRRIEFASPGVCDLAGLGKAIRELRIFVMDIVDRWIHSEDREIAREEARQRLLEKKLRNASTMLKIIQKLGIGTEGQKVLLEEVIGSDYTIEEKVVARQIESVKSDLD